MSIETLLNDEIETQLEELRNLEMGTEEHKIATESLTKLMDRQIEMSKFDAELEDKIKSRNIDNEIKLQQMEDEKSDRKWKNILTALGIAVPTGVTIWGTIKSINFEKTGSITTIMGRGFIQKLLPKK